MKSDESVVLDPGGEDWDGEAVVGGQQVALSEPAAGGGGQAGRLSQFLFLFRWRDSSMNDSIIWLRERPLAPASRSTCRRASSHMLTVTRLLIPDS
jgi:hypothetical protein